MQLNPEYTVIFQTRTRKFIKVHFISKTAFIIFFPIRNSLLSLCVGRV